MPGTGEIRGVPLSSWMNKAWKPSIPYHKRSTTEMHLNKTHIMIIICTISIFLIFVVSMINKSLADACTATGTVGAVIWAIFHQEIKKWYNRPDLRVTFKQESSFFGRTPESIDGRSGIAYYMHVHLENQGGSTAKNCQPFLTAILKKGPEGWERISGWLPIALKWVLDEHAERAKGQPTEERNIIPNRPYFFNVACIGTLHPDELWIVPISAPYAQQTNLSKGEYFFEITIFAENTAEPKRHLFYIDWKGGFKSASMDGMEYILIHCPTAI